MPDAVRKRSYLGTLPSTEVQIALRAAKKCGFGVQTYGAGRHYNIMRGLPMIEVTEGNEGLLLSHPEDQDPSKFWDAFHEIEGSSINKELEN